MKYTTILTALCAPAMALSFTSCGKKTTPTSGSAIQINGSDTMLQVGIAWADAYKAVNPDVTITVNGEGSGTGIAALINGTIEISQSSRALKPEEIESIKASHGGVAPVEHIVGYDGIAVFVHKDNPVKSLSIPQLKEIFGEGGSIDNWNQVGGPDLKMEIVGRNNASGTYVFFRNIVCGKGVEFKNAVSPMSGSTAVVEFCTTTPAAIGYSGMGYVNANVGLVGVSKEDGGTAYEPNAESVGSGTFPIARPLYIFTVGEPTGATKDYLDWIKGPSGQKVVEAEKFVALPK
ncbi:MAG: phosphate ABC transporter substrate-binding protein [Verrucomicrobia bacterium]|nr:phosphate ABC transporter substrate-binding protein [Verrucomicrobiota bacterium]